MIPIEDLADVLDRLCPMHVLLDDTGHVRRVGPTLQKLRPDQPMAGRRFLEFFELTRPRAVNSVCELLDSGGEQINLTFRDAPRTGLKGQIVAVPGGAIVSLSFGISVLEAVRDYALTSADFSATDLAIELLYLVEAKSAAMEASRKLNLRLQGAKIAAEEQAFTDTLTGLKNRRALDHVMTRLTGGGVPFSLMHLDLDYFKRVNDTLGHAAGDYVLQHVARIMVEETRREDTVVRAGGDEFVIIFDRLLDRKRLGAIAQRLIDRLEQPITFEGRVCRVSTSIGIALSSEMPRPEPAQLLHRADLALYAAKRDGRGDHRFFRPEMAPEDRPPPAPATAAQPSGCGRAPRARSHLN